MPLSMHSMKSPSTPGGRVAVCEPNSVVLKMGSPGHLGACQKCRFPGPTLELLNQTPVGRAQRWAVNSPPGDSDGRIG